MKLNKRMALLALLIWMMGVAQRSYAQGWNEWFRQADTQKRYLLEQLAAWKLYAGYVQNGYTIAREGWAVVKDISDGEFSLHGEFLNGLKRISPAITRDGRMVRIVALHLQIVRSCGRLESLIGLSATQRLYLQAVNAEVLKECVDDLAELLLLLSADKLAMNEQDRLARLAGIEERMAEKWRFVQDFSAKVSQTLKWVDQENRGLDRLGGLYDRKE
jgi:hypothetical protein